jgi:hypothetical protein
MLNPRKPAAQPLTQMWDRHKEIARRLLAGDRAVDIATDLGMTQSRLSIIRNSPIFIQHMQSLQVKCDNTAVEVRDRIARCSPKAMDVLEDILDDKHGKYDPALQVKVAHDMLDRDGFGAVQKSANFSAVITGDDIERLKQRKAQSVVNP